MPKKSEHLELLYLTAIKDGTWHAKVLCDCGLEFEEALTKIKMGKRLSCSKSCNSLIDKRRFIGQRTHTKSRLIIKDIIKVPDTRYLSRYEIHAKCVCDCSNEIQRPFRHLFDGRINSCGCIFAEYAKSMVKEKNPNWGGGITAQRILDRNSGDYRAWRSNALVKYNQKCACCGTISTAENHLCVHHILNFNQWPKLMYDDNNSIILCRQHHTLFHNYYDYQDNDGEQLAQFLKNNSTLETLP